MGCRKQQISYCIGLVLLVLGLMCQSQESLGVADMSAVPPVNAPPTADAAATAVASSLTSSSTSNSPTDAIPGAATENASSEVSGASSASDTPQSDATSTGAVKPTTADARLAEYMVNREYKKFTGKPISLNVRDAEVTDVLRLISDASGFNVVVGDDVVGKVTLSLADVPWDQALDLVLHTMQLGAERNNSILRISTLKNLTNEKQQELQAVMAIKASTPKITRVFPVSYATIKDLVVTLSKFSSATLSAAGSGGGSGGGSSSADPVIVQEDNRTNSVIIHDLPENIDRMKKLIEILDTQTPQVLIEAKVLEASEDFSKSLSGSLGIGSGSTGFLSFAGGNPIDQLVGTPGVFATGKDVGDFSGAKSLNGSLGFSPTLSFINGSLRLNTLLSMGENESKLKVISSPKTVVISRQKASILETTPVAVPGSTTVAGVGLVPVTTVQNANLGLTVTPTVTNDGSVLLDLQVNKDVPVSMAGGTTGISQRNLTTQVLVESGTTLVIGGIYTSQQNDVSAGFPFLRKLPIIGGLFGNESSSTQRSELFIFVTPRILNAKDTFLGG